MAKYKNYAFKKVLTMIEVAGAAEAFKANVFVVWANTDMMFLCWEPNEMLSNYKLNITLKSISYL